MARPLSDPQRQEVATFIRALYRLGGYATQKEFADDAGYHPVSMSDAMNGKAGVDGLNLIRMIKAAASRAGADPVDAAISVSRVPLTVEEEKRRSKLLAEAEAALARLREEIR